MGCSKKELEKVKIPDKPPEKVSAAVVVKKSPAEPKKDSKPEDDKVKKICSSRGTKN